MSIRALVVDDSAFARKVMREVLSAGGVDVVDIARDGLEALEKIAEHKPDVVTLDLMMPHLDGVGVLAALPAEGAPRVVVVTTLEEDADLALTALQRGAFALVHKPTALATSRLYEVGDELLRTVRAAASGRAPAPLRDAPHVVGAPAASDRLVVIGTSTGGPQALTRLLRALPAGFAAPIAIALHIPPGYTESLSRRINEEAAIEVVEASDGLELAPGRAMVARAGHHLLVTGAPGRARAKLSLEPSQTLHRPSVDVLFESAAAVWGANTIGVVLTGMGDDGTRGARAIHEAGGVVLTESEASCVVYGMPRSVREAGLSSAEAPLERMAQLISSRL